MTYSNNYQNFNNLLLEAEAVEITIQENGYAYVIDELFNSVKIKKNDNNKFFQYIVFKPDNWERFESVNSHIAPSSLDISYYYKNGNINNENHMLIMAKEKVSRDVSFCLYNLRCALAKQKKINGKQYNNK